MDERRGQEAEPLPGWAVPVRRSDAVGLLAWRAVGGDGADPDPSALPALADALREAGEGESVPRVVSGVRSLVQAVQEALRNGLSPAAQVRERMERTRQDLTHLLYDLNSMASVLSRALGEGEAAARVTVETTLPGGEQVVRVRLPRWRSVGERFDLPDGRTGTVVSELGDRVYRVLVSAGGAS